MKVNILAALLAAGLFATKMGFAATCALPTTPATVGSYVSTFAMTPTTQQISMTLPSWPNGKLTATCTLSTATGSGPAGGVILSVAYTNFVWVDSNGVSHPFSTTTGAASASQNYGYMPPPSGELVYEGGSANNLSAISSDGSYYLSVQGFTPTLTQQIPVSPKYQVLSVLYAPPGAPTGNSSTINYSSTWAVGSKVTVDNSFTNAVSVNEGVQYAQSGWSVGGSTTFGWSKTFDQSDTNSTSLTDTQSVQLANTSTTQSINHDFDQITILLNPMVTLGATSPTTITTYNLGLDPRDTQNNPNGSTAIGDTVTLLAGWLNGHLCTFPFPANNLTNANCPSGAVVNALSRSWDTTNPNAAMVQADLSTILSLDPWAAPFGSSSSSTPLSDDVFNTHPGRFTPVSLTGNNVQINNGNTTEPAEITGYEYFNNPNKYAITISGVKGTDNSNTTSDTISVGLEIDAGIGNKTLGWSGSLKATDTWSWTHKVITENSTQSTQAATATVVTPTLAMNPPSTDMVLYQDNEFGTFVFGFPVTMAQTRPYGLSFTTKPSTITLSWKASTSNVGAAGYYVTLGSTTVNVPSTGTSYTFTGLPANTLYNATVQAYDASGNVSAVSLPLEVNTYANGVAPSTTPTNLTDSGITTSGFTVSWTAPPGQVKSYQVWVGNTAYTVPVGTTSYTATGLTTATVYNVDVRSLDAVGDWSPLTPVLNVETH